MRFDKRVAVVTGGSQGIGEAAARVLARDGASVAVLASSSVEKAQRVAASLPGQARAYAADVRDGAALRRVIDAVRNDYGRIDILVNSAGVFYPTPVGETDDDAYDRTMDINVKGTWNAIGAVAATMKAARYGKIVNVASVCGMTALGGYAVYSASKAAVIMMTRALTQELSPHGINVNVVAPGNTETPMNHDIRTKPELKPFLDAMAARTPSGQTYSSAEDIANIIAFLASDAARAMHGACVLADEGFSSVL